MLLYNISKNMDVGYGNLPHAEYANLVMFDSSLLEK